MTSSLTSSLANRAARALRNSVAAVLEGLCENSPALKRRVMSQFERSDAAGPRDCVPQKLREPEGHRLLGRASTCQVSAGRSPAVRKLGHYQAPGYFQTSL